MQKYVRNIRLLFVMRSIGALHFDRGIFLIYLVQHKLSDAEISILQIWLFLVLLVMEVPSGVFADSFGRKWSMFVSAVCSMVYAMGMLYADEFWLFFTLFGIYGLGFALLSGADTAMLYDTLKVMRRNGDFNRRSYRHPSSHRWHRRALW